MDNMLIFLVTPQRLKGRGCLQMPHCLNGRDERERGGQVFAEKHRAEEPHRGFRVTIADKDIAHAGRFPLTGWPEYNIPPPPYEGRGIS